MSEPVVAFRDVGKMYKLYGSRTAGLLDALGLARFVPRVGQQDREFWALRDIDFELRSGERLGVIGRNGAGKTTLLKLVTGNFPPTEGAVDVNGTVQALLEIGGGLHPEFTGSENIRAALSYAGLSPQELRNVEADIAEFTELGRFLGQPFKTYSLGMQSRLSFAIATSIAPEILIVDEVLGAGDAYFFAKSTARMRSLIEGGAAVILVSHALDQVARFCDQTIWLDRGRIVMRGETNEVVKAYERFIRDLDEQRLRAKNRKIAAGSYDSFQRDSYTDCVTVTLQRTGEGTRELREARLLRDGEVEAAIRIGDTQDADATQQAQLDGTSAWGSPRAAGDGYLRELPTNEPAVLRFHLWFLYPESRYELELVHRGGADTRVQIGRDGSVDTSASLEASSAWTTTRLEWRRDLAAGDQGQVTHSRWIGAGGLAISSVRLLGEGEEEKAVFVTGEPLSVSIEISAQAGGAFPLILAVLIFRSDGVVATRHVVEAGEVALSPREAVHARLDLGRLLLGNGTYLVSIGLYGKLDVDDIEPSEFYDYLDRSFEFRVIGNPTLHNELVHHPAEWQIERVGSALTGEARPGGHG